MSQRFFVTGAAGFIGSNLVDRLLVAGHDVVGFDNLSTGRMDFLQGALRHRAFTLIEGDTADQGGLERAMTGCQVVCHLAANADVRFGTDHPGRDLKENTIGTFNVLEAMRAAGINRIVFSSTGSIYGEPDTFPTPEHAPMPVQTSLYGASKLAGEGLITAYCEGFGFQAHIFRFVSILGERYTHGHVFDFCRSLRRDSTRLRVLGDGRQRKSYLYVGDCVDAIMMVLANARERLTILNLGTNEYCAVNDSIGWITSELGVSPTLEYVGGERGWVGDSPFIFLDTSRVRALGWVPTLSIREGIVRTVRYLQAHPEVFDARS